MFLFGWEADSVRPPIKPVPVGALIAAADEALHARGA
jgi:hypothetical protein